MSYTIIINDYLRYKNKIYIKKIYLTLVVILLVMILAIFLSACSVGMYSKNQSRCQINDNVEYLNSDSLSALLSEDTNITLPNSCIDYDVPTTNVVDNKEKIGKQVDICPPMLFLNPLDKSCLIQIENIAN